MRNKILLSVAAINLLASVQILAAQNGESSAGKETLRAVEVTSEQRRDDVKYNAKELVKSTTRPRSHLAPNASIANRHHRGQTKGSKYQ